MNNDELILAELQKLNRAMEVNHNKVVHLLNVINQNVLLINESLGKKLTNVYGTGIIKILEDIKSTLEKN